MCLILTPNIAKPHTDSLINLADMFAEYIVHQDKNIVRRDQKNKNNFLTHTL
jgi:hypothetical protein